MKFQTPPDFPSLSEQLRLVSIFLSLHSIVPPHWGRVSFAAAEHNALSRFRTGSWRVFPGGATQG
ncbi:hypothetical protein E2C01_066032 [Portunus trituberculatus]|uniref:Uncharacterized protein n=1 Tax=Portunus trituberculatus TaxID=210409 RepID=A0A5B7HP81_PORTR|nr:hypothetical protein [Portunus trituberculatus]